MNWGVGRIKILHESAGWDAKISFRIAGYSRLQYLCDLRREADTINPFTARLGTLLICSPHSSSREAELNLGHRYVSRIKLCKMGSEHLRNWRLGNLSNTG